jgi:hypothetical protein
VRYTAEGPFLWLHGLTVPTPPNRPSESPHASFVEQHHRDFFFLKTLDWRSEYEYRFVVTAPGDEYLPCRLRGCSAVVVGEKFPGSEVLNARRVSERAGAEPLALKWASGGPVLLWLRTPEEREAELRRTGAEFTQGLAAREGA